MLSKTEGIMVLEVDDPISLKQEAHDIELMWTSWEETTFRFWKGGGLAGRATRKGLCWPLEEAAGRLQLRVFHADYVENALAMPKLKEKVEGEGLKGGCGQDQAR